MSAYIWITSYLRPLSSMTQSFLDAVDKLDLSVLPADQQAEIQGVIEALMKMRKHAERLLSPKAT